ncbi:MAG: GvpL/GvpF family gas vesicle protein [Nitrospirota bacterium]
MSKKAKQNNLSMEIEKNLIYLYCVTNKAPELKGVEDLVEGVYSIYQDGLYAVVSRVFEDEFGEKNLKKNLGDIEWLTARVRIHEGVIEGVMRNTCVVPFKFATLFNSENSLKAMLKEHARDIKTNLQDLEGKEEWGVKIYGHIERLKEVLFKQDEGLLALDKELCSASAGKAFFLKKKKEGLLNTIVNEGVNRYGQDSFERLSKQSIRSRINKLLPKEVTEREEDMILNSAFLVEKERVHTFMGIVEFLKTQYKESGLSFDCTGPWPPYNFCVSVQATAKQGKKDCKMDTVK